MFRRPSGSDFAEGDSVDPVLVDATSARRHWMTSVATGPLADVAPIGVIVPIDLIQKMLHDDVGVPMR